MSDPTDGATEKKPVRNIAASVRHRLGSLAKVQQVEFQQILVRYALERLLYRISVSPFQDRFILKGAMLFPLWLDEPRRRTRDLDLLGQDAPEAEIFAEWFCTICGCVVEEDGLRFAPETVVARHIREENAFGGIRITLTAFLENARIALQVDVGFGDATVPEPEWMVYPTLLPFPAPRLRAYRKETSIAEKLHALVTLDRANSRMKDFFDLYVLAREFSFEGDALSAAIHATFSRQGTRLPEGIPDGLTQAFAQDAAKQAQWRAFLHQNVAPPLDTLSLPTVIEQIASFLLPPLAVTKETTRNGATWHPDNQWTSNDERTTTHDIANSPRSG